MKKILVICCLSLFVASCEKENLPNVGGTAAERMANEWFVSLYQNGTDLAGGSRFKLLTYNTSANDNTIWVDDQAHLWDFKVKAQANYENLTFSATDAVSVVPGYDIKVDITDGKILKDIGRSRTGNVTDSIYMKIEFEDDPGTIYEIKGHGRTKFAEDEY